AGRAAVERADVLRVELERAPPVGQRTLRITEPRLRLRARCEQGRVVRRKLEPGLRDVPRPVEGVRAQVRAREKAMLPELARRSRQPRPPPTAALRSSTLDGGV